MKALTLHQPWASIIAQGHKTIETRSWPTKHRGPLAIHAARATAEPGIDEIIKHLDDQHDEIRAALHGPFPLGAVVCTATLTDCIRMDDQFIATIEPFEHALGDYAPGRFAWILENIEPVTPPIAARGAQGLWEWVE